MEYNFDGTVKVNPELVLHSSDRIVVAAETDHFVELSGGRRSHLLVLDQKEGLPMGDGVLGLYASWDAAKLERFLDYKDTRSNRDLKLRFVTYVRGTEGHSFDQIHQAIVSASRREDILRQQWQARLSAYDHMDDLITRELMD